MPSDNTKRLSSGVGAEPDCLEGIYDTIGPATAARMAITACAPRRNRVQTAMRLDASEEHLIMALQERARSHSERAQLDEVELLRTFGRLLPACRRGGQFHTHAIRAFAGKDIFSRLQNSPGIRAELKDRKRLVERVLHALEHDAAPHLWLPEWETLRTEIQDWSPLDAPSEQP